MRRDPTERLKNIRDLLKNRHRLTPVCAPKTFITDVLEVRITRLCWTHSSAGWMVESSSNSIGFQAEKTGEVHELYQWLETDGFVPVHELVSLENVRGILNGTRFIFLNCETTHILLANTYFALPEKHRGYLICLEQNIFTAPSVWYFKKTLPMTLVNEFNRRLDTGIRIFAPWLFSTYNSIHESTDIVRSNSHFDSHVSLRTRWIFEAPTRFVFSFKYPHIPQDRFARSTSLSGDAVMEALSVDEIIGCFYVLAAGSTAAFVFLLMETIVFTVAPVVTKRVGKFKWRLSGQSWALNWNEHLFLEINPSHI